MGKKNSSTKSDTDWKKIDAMRDKDIDLSDVPEVSPEMFAKGIVRRGLKPIPKKSQITLRLDQDVLTWFKGQGRGYQTRINSLLRAYMDAHQVNKKNKVVARKN